MKKAHIKSPKTDDEFGRQRALDAMNVVDTPKEPEFERITELVKSIFGAPVVAVSIIDRRRQWFKSIQGLDVKETTRDVAFCNHTIRQGACFKVEDATKDPLFANNPLVTGEPGIRSYLGAPLKTQDGYMLGALCVIDYEPRTFTSEQEIMLASFADVVMSEMELRRSASIDDLTRLPNRRAFNDSLLSAAENPESCLIFLDIDHFKKINDTYGHGAGDIVLRTLAGVLGSSCGPETIAFRIGGEEFGIVLRGEDAKQSVAFAEKLRKTISDLVIDEVEKKTITASFGIAKCVPNESTDVWRERADKALYRSKNEGRDRVTVADWPKNKRLRKRRLED